MDLSEVLSKACVDVFRYSVDEDFRQEFLGFLKVTNGTDADDILAKKFKLLKQKPRRHNLRITSHSSTQQSSSTQGAASVQNPVFPQENTTRVSVSESSENVRQLEKSPDVSNKVQPLPLTHLKGDCGRLGGVPSTQISGVSFKEIGYFDCKPTNIGSKPGLTNVSKAQTTVQNDEEEDEFGFWEVAYKVIGAVNCESSPAKDQGPSKDIRGTTAAEQVSGFGLQLQNTSVKTNTELSQSILREDHQEEVSPEGLLSSPMEVDENFHYVKVAEISSNKTAEESNIIGKSEHTQPSRSILVDDEDEFGFWSLVDGKCTPNKLPEISLHKIEENNKVVVLKVEEVPNTVNNSRPSRSAISNDEEDEFGFWDLVDNNFISNKVKDDSSDNQTETSIPRHAKELNFQKSNKSNKTLPSDLFLHDEDLDEFDF